MTDSGWLWAFFTIIAAAAQTARNAMQRELTASLGTVGATHVRFLFGFPFALLFLVGVTIALGERLPSPPLAFWPWVLAGAFTQIAATALMLAAMNDRSFVVTIAYIKTEAVQVALFGFVLLGDVVTLPMAIAILIATAGVLVMSLKPGVSGGFRPTLLGLAAGALFGLSATGYRGAILSLSGQLRGRRDVHAGGRARDPGRHPVALSLAARPRRAGRHRQAGGRRCWPSSWVRWHRSSGSSPSRCQRRACARSRW